MAAYSPLAYAIYRVGHDASSIPTRCQRILNTRKCVSIRGGVRQGTSGTMPRERANVTNLAGQLSRRKPVRIAANFGENPGMAFVVADKRREKSCRSFAPRF